jgi:putative ABC transport system permease protein
MGYTVQQRSRELAVRAALGATPLDVKKIVVLQSLRLTLWGTVVGVPLSLVLSRVTISLIFGIQAWDPVVLAFVVSLLCAISLFAAYVPAVRAARVNLATALHSEV